MDSFLIAVNQKLIQSPKRKSLLEPYFAGVAEFQQDYYPPIATPPEEVRLGPATAIINKTEPAISSCRCKRACPDIQDDTEDKFQSHLPTPRKKPRHLTPSWSNIESPLESTSLKRLNRKRMSKDKSQRPSPPNLTLYKAKLRQCSNIGSINKKSEQYEKGGYNLRLTNTRSTILRAGHKRSH